MTVTAQHFLDSAVEIVARGIDEISLRNAISRAYYAAYHKACSVIAPCDDNDGNTGMHRQYINQLNKAGNGTIARKAGLKLGAMHSRRVKSDYHLNENVTQSDYSIQISAANELFSLLSVPHPDSVHTHSPTQLKIVGR